MRLPDRKNLFFWLRTNQVRLFLFLHIQLTRERMKKVFHILIAFYLQVLIFAPCADVDISVYASTSPLVSSATIPIHQSHHDCCSPFCTCSCCSAPFEVLITCFVSQDHFLNGTLTFFSDSRFRTRYDFTIWEPPKA